MELGSSIYKDLGNGIEYYRIVPRDIEKDFNELDQYRALGSVDEVREVYSKTERLIDMAKQYTSLGSLKEIKSKLEELERLKGVTS